MDSSIEPAVILPNTTAVSLDLPNYLPFDQWLSYLTYVKTVERAWSWWLGDLLNAAERFGYFDEALQAVHEMGFADSTCSNAKSIALRIPKERRVLGLEYSHHKEVAYLEPVVADRILDKAARGKWTVEQVRHERLLTKVTTNGSSSGAVPPPSRQVRDLLYKIRDELDAIANSDAQMGCYDIEHLSRARDLVAQALEI